MPSEGSEARRFAGAARPQSRSSPRCAGLRSSRNFEASPHCACADTCRAAAPIMRIFLSVVAAALLLGGCSTIRIAYNQAEHIIVWRTDDYFDLTDDQKRMLRAELDRIHAWHRATQLEVYAHLLEALDRRLARGPKLEDANWAVDSARAQSRELVLHAYKQAAAVLATLSDEQIAAARRRFERDNREFARGHGVGAPEDKQKSLRAKRDLETIERWAGSPDPEQRAHFIALSAAKPLDAALRLQDRVRRQNEFVALLGERHDARFAQRLRDWLLDWNAQRPPDLQRRVDEYQQAHRQMLLSAFGELRPEQRHKVSERLRYYITALRDLARDATRRGAAGASARDATMP